MQDYFKKRIKSNFFLNFLLLSKSPCFDHHPLNFFWPLEQIMHCPSKLIFFQVLADTEKTQTQRRRIYLSMNHKPTTPVGRLCFGRHSSKQHFLGIQLCVRLNQLFNLGHYSNKSLSYTTTFWAWSVIIHLIYSIAGYSIYIGLEIV